MDRISALQKGKRDLVSFALHIHATVWVQVMCVPQRPHVLKFNPHCVVVKGWKIDLTIVFRVGPLVGD